MAWLEIHQSLINHRKTLETSDALDIKPVYLIGHLVSGWLWCLDNAPDGNLGNIKPRTFARACQWDDDPQVFMDALVEGGFIDHADDGLIVHDWWDYAGKLIERRESNAQRMREKRATHVQDTCETRAPATVPNSTEHNTTEQNTTEPKWNGASRPRQARTTPKEPNRVFALFSAYCEGLGIDPKTIPKDQRGSDLKAAASLLDAGYTPEEVMGCTRETKAQPFWRDKALRLRNVASEIPQWKQAVTFGEVIRGKARGSPGESDADSVFDRFKQFD